MVGTSVEQPAARAHTGFWRHPRRVWARRALFQIHLWVGIVLCAYSLVIGVSGSILVFEDEFGRMSYPEWMQPPSEKGEVVSGDSFARVARSVRQAYPGWKLGSLYAPGVRGGNYAALVSRAGKYSYVFASAGDEHLLGTQALDRGWLNWVADLHFRLLAGPTGLIVNGIGAGCLLLLCVSGVVIWWPGVKMWKRALTVDFRRQWKRINFDLHSAIGFWTLGILCVWSVSGIYFVWPEAFVSAVNSISKAPHAGPPKFHLSGHVQSNEYPIEKLIALAMAAEPGGRLQGIIYSSGDQPLSVLVARKDVKEFLHTSWVYLDPVDGAIAGHWQSGKNGTAGDWFIWLLEPLHFGTDWGMGIKILWAFLGTMLPVLAISGVLMYWNRYLSRKWRALRR